MIENLLNSAGVFSRRTGFRHVRGTNKWVLARQVAQRLAAHQYVRNTLEELDSASAPAGAPQQVCHG